MGKHAALKHRKKDVHILENVSLEVHDFKILLFFLKSCNRIFKLIFYFYFGYFVISRINKLFLHVTFYSSLNNSVLQNYTLRITKLCVPWYRNIFSINFVKLFKIIECSKSYISMGEHIDKNVLP